jgi:hypothetical protein
LATRRIRERRESSPSTPAELHVRAAAQTTEIALDDGATGTTTPTTTTTAVGSTTAAGSHRTTAPQSTTQAGNEITVDETVITSDRMGEWSEISDWLDEYLSEVPSGAELATFAPLTGAAETQRPVETEPRDQEPCGGGRSEEAGGAVRRSDSLWSRRFQRESDDGGDEASPTPPRRRRPMSGGATNPNARRRGSADDAIPVATADGSGAVYIVGLVQNRQSALAVEMTRRSVKNQNVSGSGTPDLYMNADTATDAETAIDVAVTSDAAFDEEANDKDGDRS